MASIYPFIHSFNKRSSTHKVRGPVSSSWFNCLKDDFPSFPGTKAQFSPGRVLPRPGGRLRGHSQRGPDQPGPSPHTSAPRSPAAPSPAPRACSLDPAGSRGAGRPSRAPAAACPAPPRPAPPRPSCPALPGRRRPRLTRVLATFPLWVMFLLCFSLAIRIRCLATMAWRWEMLSSPTCKDPPRVSPRQGRARPAAPALQVARRGREPRAPCPQPPTSPPKRGRSADGSNLSSQETLSDFLAILPVPQLPNRRGLPALAAGAQSAGPRARSPPLPARNPAASAAGRRVAAAAGSGRAGGGAPRGREGTGAAAPQAGRAVSSRSTAGRG